MLKITKTLSVTVTAPVAQDAPYRFVASTDSVDREGDVLVPDGMDSTDYEKNPVILYIHDSSQPAVARCRKLYRMLRRIEVDVVFPPRPDGHFGEWEPEDMKRLVDAGLLNAVSVRGLVKPNGWREATKGDKEKYGPDCLRVIHRWSLMEISLVPLPMNQDAVLLALGKGLVSRGDIEKWGGTIPAEAAEPVEKAAVAVPAPEETAELAAKCHTISLRVPRLGTLDTADIVRMAKAKASGKLYADA